MHRTIRLALIVLLLSGCSWASIAFRATSATACAQASAASSKVCALSAATSAGSTILVGVSTKTATRTLKSVTATNCAFFPYMNHYANGSNIGINFMVARNCPSISTLTVTLAGGTSIFEVGVVEFTGTVASIGLRANTSTTGNSTSPSQSITTEDANNMIVMFSGNIGSAGIPTTSVGTLGIGGRTGSAGTDAAIGICYNNSVSPASTTCTNTITSGQWAAIAIELRSASTGADPLLVDAVGTSCDCGDTQPAGNDWVVYFPQPVLSGNAMVCGLVYDHGATLSSVSDSTGGSNTWTVDKTASGTNNDVAIVRLSGMTAGTSWAQFHFGSTLSNYELQIECKEAYHIKATSPVDVSSASAASAAGPNAAVPSMTTTVDNDLIFEVTGDDINAGIINIVDQAQTSAAIAPMAGWSPIILDTTTGMCFQDIQQTTHGAIVPTCDEESTSNFSAVAVAYKTDNAQGTAPPATGLHIDHQYTFTIYQPTFASKTVNFPADGNSIFVSNTANGITPTISDSYQDTITSSLLGSGGIVNLFYTTNTTVDPSYSFSMAVDATSAVYEFVMYDMRGVKTTSPIGCQSPVTGSGSQSVFTAGTTITNIPSGFSPCAANDILLWAMTNGCGPTQASTSPSNSVTDTIYYVGQADGSRLDFGEGHSHYVTTGTSAVHFDTTMQNLACSPSNSYTYGVWEISAAPVSATIIDSSNGGIIF